MDYRGKFLTMKKLLCFILICLCMVATFAEVYRFNFCTDEEELGKLIFINNTNEDLLIRYNAARICEVITVKRGETFSTSYTDIDIDNDNILLNLPVVFETKTTDKKDKSVFWTLKEKKHDLIITLEENSDNWHF